MITWFHYVKKLAVLSRLSSKFMSFKQRWILLKTFVESQFGYCPLIWMFHSRKINSKITRLQERSSRIVYNDHITSFEDLLKKDNSFKIHHRVKSVQIRSYFWSVLSCIRTRNNSVFAHFSCSALVSNFTGKSMPTLYLFTDSTE